MANQPINRVNLNYTQLNKQLPFNEYLTYIENIPFTVMGEQDVQAIIDAKLVPLILQIVSESEINFKSKALESLYYLIDKANVTQVQIITECGLVVMLCELLKINEPTIIILILKCLNILSISGENYLPIVIEIERCGGISTLEALQSHNNVEIYELVVKIIENYFSEGGIDLHNEFKSLQLTEINHTSLPLIDTNVQMDEYTPLMGNSYNQDIMETNAEECEQNGETNDLVIASAVEVLITMYECKFCNKRFDTIDKVKAHFLKRHSNTLETINNACLTDGEHIVANNEEMVDDNIDMKTELSSIKSEKWIHIESNESQVDADLQQNAVSVKTATVVIKKTQPNTRSNRTKKLDYNNTVSDEQESNETSNRTISTISTRSSIKKELPNHLEVKVIRSDYDPNAPLKRGRPKKYELRPQAVATKLRSAPRRYPCPFDGCAYIAKYRSNLWDHKKIHTGEKPYICTWPSCDMRFPQSQQLRLHLRSHTGEKPYKCEWNGCQMAFSQKPGLKAHLRTHTGEKPFKCDWPGCEWKFRLKGALTDHKKAVHENVKSFVCEWPGCNKKFLQSCHLRKHMMAHADIKPYQCDWPSCNYRAVSLSYVTNHKKTHTGEKNFECNFPDCNKRFVKSNHVLRHQQRCHPELFDDIIEDSYKEDEEIFNISTVDVEITAM